MSGGVQTKQIAPGDAGMRLDRWFRKHEPMIAFGQLQKLMRKGYVRLDGKRVKGDERVAVGQTVRIPPIGPAGDAPAGTPGKKAVRPQETYPPDVIKEVRSWILYEDADVIVLNKPAGLPTQGGTGVTKHLDGLLGALKAKPDAERPKLVHRLDKDTSGVLLIAKTSPAARHLTKHFASKDTEKRYWAIVTGLPKTRDGQIRMRMDKLVVRGVEKMVATPDGKHSVTDYHVVDHAGKSAAWLALRPVTGRTHQLRLHCSEMGHPIVGDGKYGADDAFLSGTISRKLHLHARFIRFELPSGRKMTVEAPLPKHMKDSFKNLGFHEGDYEDLLGPESL